MNFHICWSIDCESCRRDVNDTALGRRSIAGFCELLEAVGWRGTLFLMPEELEPMADLLTAKMEAGHEMALHLHPDESGWPSGLLGQYSAEQQHEIIEQANATFQRVLGVRPVSARPGFGSANDATAGVFAALGFRQTSSSFPGRKMTSVASNWAGAPLQAHYAHPYNRFLEGGLDLVEIPFSVDDESMIWGGIQAQDIRVEYTDAKNHAFTIRKIMRRQIDEKWPLRALLPFTHNLFDYSAAGDFRRTTMQGMIATMIDMGKQSQWEITGSTLAQAADSYRAAIPFQN